MRTKKAENEKITALYERLSRDDEMVGEVTVSSTRRRCLRTMQNRMAIPT